jgi:hypothetical protein
VVISETEIWEPTDTCPPFSADSKVEQSADNQFFGGKVNLILNLILAVINWVLGSFEFT